mgnify:CR=1 FL=1
MTWNIIVRSLSSGTMHSFLNSTIIFGCYFYLLVQNFFSKQYFYLCFCHIFEESLFFSDINFFFNLYINDLGLLMNKHTEIAHISPAIHYRINISNFYTKSQNNFKCLKTILFRMNAGVMWMNMISFLSTRKGILPLLCTG